MKSQCAIIFAAGLLSVTASAMTTANFPPLNPVQVYTLHLAPDGTGHNTWATPDSLTTMDHAFAFSATGSFGDFPAFVTFNFPWAGHWDDNNVADGNVDFRSTFGGYLTVGDGNGTNLLTLAPNSGLTAVSNNGGTHFTTNQWVAGGSLAEYFQRNPQMAIDLVNIFRWTSDSVQLFDATANIGISGQVEDCAIPEPGTGWNLLVSIPFLAGGILNRRRAIARS